MKVKMVNVSADLKNLRPKIKLDEIFLVSGTSKNPSNNKNCFLIESKTVAPIVVYPSEVEILEN